MSADYLVLLLLLLLAGALPAGAMFRLRAGRSADSSRHTQGRCAQGRVEDVLVLPTGQACCWLVWADHHVLLLLLLL
jgi:hypothetical protein